MTILNIFGSFLVIFFAAGCYTQLMTPQEYVKVRKQQSSVSTTIANNAYSINYNQSCTTCHSVAELNERAEELESYGVTTVHNGVFLSSRPWMNDSPGEIYYGDPGPVYWPTPLYPTNPWWAPPVTVITTPTTTPANGNRPRTDGSTRDGSTSGGRNSPIPPPTTAQPSAPVGGTTVTPVTTAPAPAVTVTPTPSSTTPAPTSDSERSRDTNSSGTTTTTKTRSDGSSRDSSGGSRPR